nr:RHS repeat-associated core domain-containing protein [Proteus sp. NMG38-2]
MAFWQSHDDYADNDPEYTECHFRFAGQYEDKESGLYYNRFRYYDKDTGQYILPDPIGLLGGFNPFGLSGGKGNKGDLFQYDMVNNPGPLGEHPSNIRWTPVGNFAGGKYNSHILQEDIILYRGGNGGGGQNGLGQWFTTSPPSSVTHVRIDTAVKPQCLNESGELIGKSPINAVYQVKIPKGTEVFEGPVGYQGGIYLGGQDKTQIFIKEPWKIDGVQVLQDWPLR